MRLPFRVSQLDPIDRRWLTFTPNAFILVTRPGERHADNLDLSSMNQLERWREPPVGLLKLLESNELDSLGNRVTALPVR